jgi:hypothetical protein
MKVLRLSATAAVALATGIVAHASGPIAVYAKVDRVVMEPNEQAPERIQVWGAFSVAKGATNNDYAAPAGGYLYYQLPPSSKDAAVSDLDQQRARSEWKDLKAIESTSQIVAFGSGWGGVPTLRKAEEHPGSPDRYTLNIGIQKINSNTDYAPIKALRDFKPR